MAGSTIGIRVAGALTTAMGALYVLSGFGIVPMGPSDPGVPLSQQRAVVIAMGMVFAAGGVAAILSTSGGNWARKAKAGLGFVIVAGLTSLFAWVAIGPGVREFASPFAMLGSQVNETIGRALFGCGALMGVTMAILMIRGAGRVPEPPAE